VQQNITKLYTYIKETERKTKQVIKNKIGNTKITEQTREKATGKRKTKSIFDQGINERRTKRSFYNKNEEKKTVGYEVKNVFVESK